MTTLKEDLWRNTCLIFGLLSGEMSWQEFETRYDNFYWREALHGREGDETPAEKAFLQRYDWLIDVHRRVQEDVLSISSSGGVTIDNRASDPIGKVKAIVAEAHLSEQLAERATLRDDFAAC